MLNFLLIMKSGSYFREAICSFIRAEIDGARIHWVDEVDQIQAMPAEQTQAIDLVLLYADAEQANGTACAAGARLATSALPGVPIVLLGREADIRSPTEAMRMGLKGFIPASTPAEIVKHALPLVAVGGVFLPETIPGPAPVAEAPPPRAVHLRPVPVPDAPVLDAPVFQAPDTPRRTGPPATETRDFTAREIDVLRLLGIGLQNKLIAHRLGLKESTVKVHVRHIMRKLRVTSRTQAALYAQRCFPAPADEGQQPAL